MVPTGHSLLASPGWQAFDASKQDAAATQALGGAPILASSDVNGTPSSPAGIWKFELFVLGLLLGSCIAGRPSELPGSGLASSSDGNSSSSKALASPAQGWVGKQEPVACELDAPASVQNGMRMI
jgi:hypothetical protein